MSRKHTVPTVVVGVGGAGCRMLDAVAGTAERRGVADRFELVAVDSYEEDLDRHAPGSASTVTLALPDRFEQDGQSYPYLRPDAELSPVGGTERQRPVGRYLLDSGENFDRALDALEDAVDSAAASLDPAADGSIAAVVVHALGGGTGSGAAPLLSAMLREVVNDAGVDAGVHGVGSVPRLDDLAKTHLVPEGNPSYYLNAYAALREARALVDPDGAELRVEASSSRLATDGFEFAPVLDGYLLVGLSEHAPEAEREAANRTVADAVHAVVSPPADDDATPGVALDGPFVSLDGARVRFPFDLAREVLDADERVEEADERLAALERDVEAARHAASVLGALASGDASSLRDVAPEFVDACRERARTEASPDPDAVEAAIDDLAAAHESVIQDRIVEPTDVGREELVRAVAARLYGDALADRLSERLADHRLHRTLERARDLTDVPDGEPAEDVSPDEAADAVVEAIEGRIRSLRERADDRLLPTLSPAARRLRDRAEELEEFRNVLLDRLDDYRRLSAVHTRAKKAAGSAGVTLREARNAAERRADALREERDAVEADRRAAAGRRDSLAERLEAPGRGSPGTRHPPVNASALDAAVLDDCGSLAAFSERGVLEEEGVERAVERALGSLADTVADRARLREGSRSDRLVGFLPEADEPFVAADAFDDVRLRAGASAEARFVAFYDPLEFEATSEFGAIHDLYTDPERDAARQFGLEADEEEAVQRAFAYPELLSDPLDR